MKRARRPRVHRGGKPLRLSKAEVAERARRIVDAYLEEERRPLTDAQLGTVILALAKESIKEHESDLLTWADRGGGAYACCYAILKRHRHDLPDQVLLALAAWALATDVCGAVRR